MRKYLILLAVCGGLGIAAPALASNATISGTITHATDSAAIASMYITAQNVDTHVSSADTSENDGTYSITVAPGTYDVTPSFVTTDSTVTYIKKVLTVTVASDETKSGQNFSLTRRGWFSGHVYSSDGVTPVSTASISATHTSGYVSGSAYTLTASNGNYTATPTPSDTLLSATGTYSFIITKAGYFSGQFTNVALSADEAAVTQNFTLIPASTVSGTIRDANAAAVANATVTLTKIGSGSAYTATTNASGAYTISIFDTYPYNGSAVADYSVSVSKTGFVTKTATLSITADASALTGSDFSLVTAGIITGTIANSAGTGLSGATVTADDGYGNIVTATTDASGAYTLSTLRPSTRYTLTATKTNFVGQKAYGISVTSGATVSGRNFTLPAGKVYSGTVTAAGGAALEGATVNLYKLNKARSEVADFSYSTKSDGGFIFRNVSPSKYLVKVIKSGYVTLIEDSVTITADVTGKAFKLDLGATISGQVIAGNNAGVASADIAVYALNNGKVVAYATTSSDENGYYLVSGLKAGTYRLKVAGIDYVTRIVKVTVKTGAQATSNIKLSSAGSVSGFITDKETGLPVVTLVRVVGTALAAWSNANGYYIVDGVAPGKRKITIVDAYYSSPGQKKVTISSGKTKTGVNFTLTQKR